MNAKRKLKSCPQNKDINICQTLVLNSVYIEQTKEYYFNVTGKRSEGELTSAVNTTRLALENLFSAYLCIFVIFKWAMNLQH